MASRVLLALTLFVGLAAASNRIVGGQPTTVERYPWIVQVEALNAVGGTWTQFCGASILTTRYVLSAAHCFAGIFYEVSFRRVRAGSTYPGIGGSISYIEVAFNHPSYGQLGNDGDISVVRLIQPLVYSPLIQQVTIAAHGTVLPDNLPVVYAGWGRTQQGGPFADVLMHTSIFTINNTLCAERYLNRPNRPAIVTENMICVGLLDVGGRGSCHGDSGGPLYYGNILVGVVSWADGCAGEYYPSVSTAVAPYTPWIVQTAV